MATTGAFLRLSGPSVSASQHYPLRRLETRVYQLERSGSGRDMQGGGGGWPSKAGLPGQQGAALRGKWDG